MQWGKNGIESFQAKVKTTKANYVLGLNEPERFDQANMSVAAAVQLFEQHLTPLRYQDIKVSAPAVSSAPERQAWIKAFAQQCTNCFDVINAKLLRFIRRLHISDIRGVFNGGDSAHILRNMTALSVLNSCNPESSHFGAIESSSLPLTLKVLYIARLDAADVDSFANTLLSLKSLEALAINGVRGISKYSTAIVLPRSLKSALFRSTCIELLEAVGAGLQSLRPPLLRALLLYRIRSENPTPPDCSRLWNGLGSETQVVAIEGVLVRGEQGFKYSGLTSSYGCGGQAGILPFTSSRVL